MRIFELFDVLDGGSGSALTIILGVLICFGHKALSEDLQDRYECCILKVLRVLLGIE